MLAERLRVPRFLLRIPAFQPLLRNLHNLRVKLFLRPEEQAQRLINTGKPDQAVELYQQAAGGRQDLRVLLNAAQIYFASNRYDQAADAVAKAVRHSPESKEAWLALGQIEYARRRRDLALSTGNTTQHGVAVPAHPHQHLNEEEAELLIILARPPAASPAIASSAFNEEATKQLQAAAEALHAENVALVCSVDLLRQQLGHRDTMETWIKYEHTKYYMRALSLFMRKYGTVSTANAAPPELPEDLKVGFGMNGKSEIEAGYLNAAYPGHFKDIYTDFDIEAFGRLWRQEPPASDDDRQCLMSYGLILGQTDLALQRAAKARLRAGDTVAVVGSRGPVYEALCLEFGARPTTIRRMPVENRTSDVKTMSLAEWEKTTPQFDAAVAVCVVEQTGLGMHGEPLDPDGDLTLMRQLKQSVKPGGVLFLVLPTGTDRTVFNATRTYGPNRLARLLEGWTELERHRHGDPMFHGGGEDRSMFVLENRAA
jgi:tetratricopeptide (TPR) repeat protein